MGPLCDDEELAGRLARVGVVVAVGCEQWSARLGLPGCRAVAGCRTVRAGLAKSDGRGPYISNDRDQEDAVASPEDLSELVTVQLISWTRPWRSSWRTEFPEVAPRYPHGQSRSGE